VRGALPLQKRSAEFIELSVRKDMQILTKAGGSRGSGERHRSRFMMLPMNMLDNPLLTILVSVLLDSPSWSGSQKSGFKREPKKKQK